MARHYLDHASTSALRPVAVAAMREVLAGSLGDPSRIHHEGMAARVTIEEARESVAEMLGARSREVVFTSGATESIATAVWGATVDGGHVIVPAVEHSAVRAASEAYGGDVTVIGVDRCGRVDVDEVIGAIREDTCLVNLQWANHEVGTIQPVAEVVEACRARGVLVHIDAAQAAGHIPIAFRDAGIDLLSISAHKLGGPPGVGALLVRRGLRQRPLLMGGDQERARRAGLENVLGIVGFGAAASELDHARIEVESRHALLLTDRVVAVATAIDGVQAYGRPADTAPHLACLGISDIEPQAVLLGLDRAGIAAHSGSACASESLEPSPVLEAMGVDAHRSLRISVGWNSTAADVDAFASTFPEVIANLRRLRPDAGRSQAGRP